MIETEGVLRKLIACKIAMDKLRNPLRLNKIYVNVRMFSRVYFRNHEEPISKEFDLMIAWILLINFDCYLRVTIP